MLDANDLQMIGALMDEKLENKLAPIRADVSELKTTVSVLQKDMNTLKLDVLRLDKKTTAMDAKLDILDWKIDRNYERIEGVYVAQNEFITRFDMNVDATKKLIPKLQLHLNAYMMALDTVRQAAS